MSNNIQQLIDALIEHWRFWNVHEQFYLTQLAPSLVADSTKGDEVERDILDKLKRLLNESEWNALPQLIADRRQDIRRENEKERARQQAESRAREEAARIAAEKRERERRIVALKLREEARERARQEGLLRREKARREEQLRQETARREALLKQLRNLLVSDYVRAEKFYKEECSQVISAGEFHQERIVFVRSWLAKNAGGKRAHSADDEQLAAIATVNGNVLVTARAGSGKTMTLVYRAFFLIKHCGVTPNEMLLLAFNRRAALEMRRRLLALFDQTAESAVSEEIKRRQSAQGHSRSRSRRDGIEAQVVDAVAEARNIRLPHVMTFHALAYAIVHPEEPILYDDSEGGSLSHSQALQFVVDDHLAMPEYRKKFRKLMLAHFRADWYRIVEGCYEQSKEEFLRIRRSLQTESLGGDYVKSYGEKVIADFLFENDIAYKYERNHWWNGINYRPDFTIFSTPKSGLIIEYFGLKGDADYDEMSVNKRLYWKEKKEWSLIEFSPRDITKGTLESFRSQLRHELEAHDIRCKALSEDEIWHRVRERAVDRFSSTMKDFVARCRNRSLTPSDLRSLIDNHRAISNVEEIFLELSHTLYSAFLTRLAQTGEDDFDGLMQRAAASVDSGRFSFERKSGSGNLSKLRHVFIDEFQDFSDLFYRLLSAVFKSNPSVELFCVGDDWQAINGFAGSDLRFFQNFEKYVGTPRYFNISTNYRSHRAIVSIGNALMDGFGIKAQAHRSESGTVLLADLQEFEPFLTEKQRHRDDAITPAVLRVVNRALGDGLDVVLLCRRNWLPWFVNYQEVDIGRARGLDGYLELLRSFFPKGLKERITISTAHKYKGLERAVVIVLDAVASCYPLIHPNWVFSRILGDSPETIVLEERRLFYVALTRAIESLVIFTDQGSKSPFLADLERKQVARKISWDEFPPVRGAITRLVVEVGNQVGRGGAATFAIKDSLKAAGYQWQNKGWPSWVKSYPAEGFSVKALESELWAAEADGIEVRILDDTESVIAQYSIDGGNWLCRLDQLGSLNLGMVKHDA